MTEDTDRSSRMKTLVAAAAGPVAQVKGLLAKAAQTMTGLIRSRGARAGGGATAAAADGQPTDSAVKMKAAVEAARQSQPDD